MLLSNYTHAFNLSIPNPYIKLLSYYFETTIKLLCFIPHKFFVVTFNEFRNRYFMNYNFVMTNNKCFSLILHS